MKLLSLMLVVCFVIPSCHLRQESSAHNLWSSKDTNKSWTRTTEVAIKNSNLYQQNPSDISSFCPGYSSMGESKRVDFWLGLISAMALYESNLDPKTQYNEKIKDSNGHAVVSRGLLQLSLESANQKRYACNIANDKDLHNPTVNLQCGIKILHYWVDHDSQLGGTQGAHLGGARYWSVLRPAHPSFHKIQSATRAFSFCKT